MFIPATGLNTRLVVELPAQSTFVESRQSLVGGLRLRLLVAVMRHPDHVQHMRVRLVHWQVARLDGQAMFQVKRSDRGPGDFASKSSSKE